MDFVSDALTDSRRFRILVVVDDFTRECLCLVADTSLSGVTATTRANCYQRPTRRGDQFAGKGCGSRKGGGSSERSRCISSFTAASIA
jgi:hypothetical protein